MGRFPITNAYSQRHAVSLALNRKELYGSLERVAQFTEKSRCVVVEVSQNQLTVRAQDTAVGESEEALPVIYGGEMVRIGFNAGYLADFLGRAKHNEVRFLFNNADGATEWQPVTDATVPDLRYVVMPMRVN